MIKAIIFDFNRTIFNPDKNMLFPSAIEVLSFFRAQSKQLFLVSKATENKEKRFHLIESLGLMPFFKEVIISKEKSLQAFKALLKKNSLKPEETAVIGDRIKKEILLGNKLGCLTIWLKKGKFAKEKPESTKEKPNLTIKELNELLSLKELI